MEAEEMGDGEKETDKFRVKEDNGSDDRASIEDIICGYGPFRGKFLQRFATKKCYILVYGILGLVNSARWSYFNGTINTMEKRFKIPSKTLGFMDIATNASQLFMSTVLGYWAGKGHRPRWVAIAMVAHIVQIILNILPHILYGSGDEALQLTEEYNKGANVTLLSDLSSGDLCGEGEKCVEATGGFIQPFLILLSKFVGGLNGGLFYTAGVSYIDDNMAKAESPFLISLTFFIRMLGPSVGYALAAMCLKWYISPLLTPIITPDDPRWLGAWWAGWILFFALTVVLTFLLSLFPKVLPGAKKVQNTEQAPSFKDLLVTIRRLLKNKIYVCNFCSSTMYILGDTPYWIYLAKYIETEYQQNASVSNFVTGTVILATSCTGILISGYVIGRLRPSARTLAGWNVCTGTLILTGYISFMFINCESQVTRETVSGLNLTAICTDDCDCEYAAYAPVCSGRNQTFLSPCHAGCHSFALVNGTKIYTDCDCTTEGTATPGLCEGDCMGPLKIFLSILCILKLAESSGMSSNFLVGVRCIDEKDKSAAMGFSLTVIGVLAFAPAPLIYGYILDGSCIVWGKTCEGNGNCWMYDGPNLAYTMNLTAASFTVVAVLFDMGVWYHSKNLKIFDN